MYLRHAPTLSLSSCWREEGYPRAVLLQPTGIFILASTIFSRPGLNPLTYASPLSDIQKHTSSRYCCVDICLRSGVIVRDAPVL